MPSAKSPTRAERCEGGSALINAEHRLLLALVSMTEDAAQLGVYHANLLKVVRISNSNFFSSLFFSILEHNFTISVFGVLFGQTC